MLQFVRVLLSFSEIGRVLARLKLAPLLFGQVGARGQDFLYLADTERGSLGLVATACLALQ